MTQLGRAGWQSLLLAEERKLGLSQGFKMLYGPWSSLSASQVAFLSLKPGVAPPGADLRTVSDERGNSYEVERATTVSPITEQFLALCALIGVAPREVLTGVVAPFRAAAWKDLTPTQREGALDFGRRFWAEPLARPDLRLIVAVSQEAADLVASLTNARLEVEMSAEWGDLRLRRYRTLDGRVVIHLPHLSRFRLMSRPASRTAVARILGYDAPGEVLPAVRRPPRSTRTAVQDGSDPAATIAALPQDARAILEAVCRSPDYDLTVMAMQMAITCRGQKVGGLNRRLMEWYVSKIFVADFDGPDPLERRGFKVLETAKGHRCWAQKGPAAGAAFAAAIGEMTDTAIIPFDTLGSGAQDL